MALASYKGRKLYVDGEYRGVITKVKYRKKTGEVVGFIIINKEGNEEDIDVNGRLQISGDSVWIIRNNDGKSGGAPVEESIESLIKQLDNYIKEINEYDEKIIKAIETMILNPNYYDKKTINEYKDAFQRRKEETMAKCKVTLSSLADKIDKLANELSNMEIEAKELELRQRISGDLSDNDKQRLNGLRNSIRDLEEKLASLYLKQKEYESKCKD